MSCSIDVFPFDCPNCNYSAQPKSQKSFDMIKRLHIKKCKKIGRTDNCHAYISTNKKINLFYATHNDGGFISAGGEFYNTCSNGDVSIAN